MSIHRQDLQQDQQNLQVNENQQDQQQADLVNQAANQPQAQQQAAPAGGIIQQLGLQQEPVIQAAPNPDLALKEEIRQAHLALHKHQADDKKQNDKKLAYDRKVQLRAPSKDLFYKRESDFEEIAGYMAQFMGVETATLLDDPENRKLAKAARSMQILFGDDINRSIPMFRTLQVPVGVATEDQLIDKRHELERIFSVILEFDMTTLDFEKAEDLTRADMKQKLAIIDLCPKIEDFINVYTQLRDMNVGCLVSVRMLREIKARTAVIEKYGEAYRERLKLMSNKYYALLLQEDTADASTRKLREKYDAAVAGNNPELVEYLQMILDKRKAKKDGTYKAANRGDKALDLLKTERGKLGLKGDEGLEAPGMDRIHSHAHGLGEQITPERFRRVLNSKRMEKKNELSTFLSQIRQTQNLPKDVLELLDRLDTYIQINVCASDGGQKRYKRFMAGGKINYLPLLKYGFAVVMRQSKTGNDVRDERHRLRLTIEDIGKKLEKYSGKDQQRYGSVVQALARLKEQLIKYTGTPTAPLDEDQKKAEYERRGWDRRPGKFTEKNLVGRKRHTIEDDDTKGPARWAMERNFGVDARTSVLFAHEPCIEDISQGAMGDCYFLAALGAVVQKNPQSIRDMMMDNGDGSVTVRFFDQINSMKPIYITVDKQVRLTGASHTIWVQVMEKAYTAYLQYKEGNELRIRRGSNQVRPYEFDRDKIEYGFISKGGHSETVLEALTGVKGERRSVKMKTGKFQIRGSQALDLQLLLMDSYVSSWSEQRLEQLREKELEHDKQMKKNAREMLKSPISLMDNYGTYYTRLHEVENRINSLQGNDKHAAEQEKKEIEDEFIREYIRRHEDAIAPVINEISSLEERTAESSNILLKRGKRIHTYEDQKLRSGSLYIDREVDEELQNLAGNHIADETTRDWCRRKLAKISEEDAVHLLISYIEYLPPENQDGLPGTHAMIYDMREADLLALIFSLREGNPEADLHYQQFYEHSLDEEIEAFTKESGLTTEQAMSLVIKNRQKIIAQLYTHRDHLKQFTTTDEQEDTANTYTPIETHYFDTIVDALHRQAYVCAGTAGSNDQQFDAGGICDNHAYSVLDAFADEKTGKKYVIVRDPHGGAGTVFKKDKDGNNTMAISEEESYGVNQLELKYFLSRFPVLYFNG